MIEKVDTSPARLRELAENIQNYYRVAGSLPVVSTLLALAAEKENPGPVCPTCGSDRNERDELIKAEREIERLRAEKETQRTLADVLPEPLFLLHCGCLYQAHGGEIEQDEWEIEPGSRQEVDALTSKHHGETIGLHPADHLRQYGQACAKEAKDAAFDECEKAIEAEISKGLLLVGDPFERGMFTALELIREAKKGTT